jgi:hypothetical protein
MEMGAGERFTFMAERVYVARVSIRKRIVADTRYGEAMDLQALPAEWKARLSITYRYCKFFRSRARRVARFRCR